MSTKTGGVPNFSLELSIDVWIIISGRGWAGSVTEHGGRGFRSMFADASSNLAWSTNFLAARTSSGCIPRGGQRILDILDVHPEDVFNPERDHA